MITTEVVESNKASWLDVAQFIERLPDNDTWSPWKSFMRALLQAGIGAGLNEYFRVGTSVGHVIFSTCEKNGLEDLTPAPPRVTLGQDRSEMFIAWSHSNIWFSEPERKDFVTAQTAFAVLRTYLAEMWRQTRPAEPFPLDENGESPSE
jgi:hypothetical protein